MKDEDEKEEDADLYLNQSACGCMTCGEKNHSKKDCPKLKNDCYQRDKW